MDSSRMPTSTASHTPSDPHALNDGIIATAPTARPSARSGTDPCPTTEPDLSPSTSRPRAAPSSSSSSFTSLSDPDDYPAQVIGVYPSTINHANRRTGLISLARRGSASSGRLMALGSVHSLGGERTVTPMSVYRGSEAVLGMGGGARAGSSSGTALVEDGRTPTSVNLSVPPITPARTSLHTWDPRGSYPEPSSSSRGHSSSHDSILALAPGGVSTLPFPSPPARIGYQHARLPPPVPLKQHTSTMSPSRPSPLSPSYRAVAFPLKGQTPPTHIPSRSSIITLRPTTLTVPNSPLSTESVVTYTPTQSVLGNLSTENDHTFGHGTSTSPIRPPAQLEPNRLSAYDPLAGEVSDVASFGSSPGSRDDLTPEVSPRSFGRDIGAGAVAGPSAPAAAVPSRASVTGRSRSTKSTKSSKSNKSFRSIRSIRARSGSSKRVSAGSVAYRLAGLSWTLRPGTPEEGDEGESLLDEGDDVLSGHGRPSDKRRKKSLRTIRREEQDLDLGRLLGRAAVLEKILSAGKRVSNQSLRFQPLRATDSPLPHPLPLIPPHHHLFQSRRRAFSTGSTIGSADTHSTSNHPSLPPLPPLPSDARRGTRHSTSMSSRLSKARQTFGRRVKRSGEWGGEGYTSLQGSEAGSQVHLALDTEMDEGGVIPFTVEEAPPTPPKPVYLGQGRRAGERPKSGEIVAGCLPGPICHNPAEIMLPLGCIPIGTRQMFNEKYHPSPANRDVPDLNRPLPVRPPRTDAAADLEKLLFHHQANPSPPCDNQAGQAVARRKSRVLSYVSTGQASTRSRRRWIILIGLGCASGLVVVGGVLAGVLGGRNKG